MVVKMGRKFLNLALALSKPSRAYGSIWGLKALVLKDGVWFLP